MGINGKTETIIEFDADDDKAVFNGGVVVDASHFYEWDVITPKDRLDSSRLADATKLAWDERASYTVQLPDSFMTSTPERLILTMANINVERVPEIQIELQTSDGVSVQRPLDDFMPFPPVITTDYTPFGIFDEIFRDGKYEKSWEPIFQTFTVPMESVEREEPTFDRNKITKISLHFISNPGEILIEGIGYE